MNHSPQPSDETSGIDEASLHPRMRGLRRLLQDFGLFSRHVIGTPLRPYQLEPALAILDSTRNGYGRTFTVMMSRQAGKNELSAQLEAYLLVNAKLSGGTIVKGAPTFHPQLATSIERLGRCLDRQLTRTDWSLRLGTIRLGQARIVFLSGQASSHVLGATASILLEIDEAQDFDEDKYLRDFRPMGAATNVTTVLYGTAWTSDTLLEHVRLENRRLEAIDGIQRNFTYPWAAVSEHNPSYRTFVQGEIQRMGAEHPLIRTQYLLEPLSAAGRLFSESQLSQIQALPQVHPVVEEARELPTDTRQQPTNDIYVAGIDLSGEDEEAEDAILRAAQPRRDSTAITIARVVWETTSGFSEPHLQVVRFYWWTGRKHRELLPQLIDLLKSVWRCQSVVVDATGVGAGIASLLVGALGSDVVHPFSFSAVSKSDLGYQLLAAVNAGRLKVPTDPNYLQPSPGFALLGTGGGSPRFPPEGGEAPLLEFWKQAQLARSTLHANQRLSFYVDPREGHDDLLIAVALAVEAAQHSRPRVAIGRIARR